MKKLNGKVGVAVGLAAGLLAMGLANLSKSDAAGRSATETTHATVVVTGIDRAARTATLQTAEGETKTVRVPEEMKSFDTLKTGDKIDIDYTETVSIMPMPAGTKPSASESSTMKRTGQGAGIGTREMTVAAEVVSVDPRSNQVTFRGPRGRTETVSVSDPSMQKQLPNLKKGQVLQITYSEGMALSLRPSAK
jgi:hypothetical protein